MATRIWSIPAVGMVVCLLCLQPSVGNCWSLNPFSSSDTKTETKKSSKKEPSAMNKIGMGTKAIFNKTGETLGLKKPEPKKKLYTTAVPKTPTLNTKKKESSSWNWFGSSEPKKKKTVNEWMKQERLDH